MFNENCNHSVFLPLQSNLACVFSLFFNFFEKIFQCQTVWIQIRTDILVGPDLGPNYLQRLSADNKGRRDNRYFDANSCFSLWYETLLK